MAERPQGSVPSEGQVHERHGARPGPLAAIRRARWAIVTVTGPSAGQEAPDATERYATFSRPRCVEQRRDHVIGIGGEQMVDHAERPDGPCSIRCAV
jgi:hypothetical protein